MKIDWLATDPEHSLIICGEKWYLYTYVTTRPLRLVYFDGLSAANSASSGALGTQDILLWGKVRPDMASNELLRVRKLCKWGEQFELDGFLRYRFSCSLSFGVFTHEILPLGWNRRACEYHPSR